MPVDKMGRRADFALSSVAVFAFLKGFPPHALLRSQNPE
jgi:hypothetical protein